MKKNITILVLLILVLAATITGCTNNIGAASSWPGFSVSDGMAVLSYGSQIFAINTENGNRQWVYPSSAEKNVMFYAPAEIKDGQVLVGDYNHTLYSINSDNGILNWKFEGAKGRYVGSVLELNGMTYAPNADHSLYVVDSQGMLNWEFKTQGPNWSKPVADDQYVYVASMDHHLYALQLNYDAATLATDENGSKVLVSEPVWSVDLGTAVVSDPLLADGFLYVGTIDGELFKVNAASGAIEWTFEGDTKIKSIWTTPLIVDSSLYFGTEDGFVYALNVESGDTIWANPTSTGSQIVASGVALNGNVGFGTIAGNLVILDKNQATSPSITRDGGIYTTPIFQDGKLYLVVVGGDKLVYALDENGREYWAFSTKE
ncbi:MAG: PQQ-binding-like beta-propeller repeat protein [Chloroflexi bacterium]|nr:PQQ-binding-like beta-propeller repeat protein [Chloroflexota bacterium]